MEGGATSNHYANCSTASSFSSVLDVIFMTGFITTVRVREKFVALHH